MNTHLVTCSEQRHGEAMLALLNHAIVTSTAIYDYHPRPASSMAGWFALRRDQGIPVIGLEAEDASLLGFASWAPFRSFAAFKYSAEHSLYVHPDYLRRGLGSRLLGSLLEHAREHGLHMLVGAIDADNQASIGLHEQHGFSHAGTLREAGFKFGRWLDLAYYQRILDTPLHPVDG